MKGGEHVKLGDAFRDKGDYDGAIAEYCEALELNPNNVGVYLNLGAALGTIVTWTARLRCFAKRCGWTPLIIICASTSALRSR